MTRQTAYTSYIGAIKVGRMKFLALSLTLCLVGVQGWEIQPRRYLVPGARSTTVNPNPGAPSTPAPGSGDPPPPADGPASAPWNVLGFFFNDRRTKHGCPNLTTSDNLQTLAQKCADFYQKGKIIKDNPTDGKDPEGFEACDTQETMTTEADYWYVAGCDSPSQITMINAWLAEDTKYTDYENPDVTDILPYRHFTQIIWKSTTSAACAISKKTVDGDATKCIHVCVFDPAGNSVTNNRNTQFKANVPAAL